MLSGFLLVNKPSGPTSHDVVDEARARLKMQKVGHAGTLDPLAEGLLILLIGEATKKSEEFLKLSKEYTATIRLGLDSDTCDIDGKIREKKDFDIPNREDVEFSVEKFRGKIKQIPPKFSAIKVRGIKAYEAARKNEEIELEAREVVINNLEVIWYRFPLLTISVKCSSGTYIRALARDIGFNLGTGGVVSHLRREAIGEYNLKDAVRLADLNFNNIESFVQNYA